MEEAKVAAPLPDEELGKQMLAAYEHRQKVVKEMSIAQKERGRELEAHHRCLEALEQALRILSPQAREDLSDVDATPRYLPEDGERASWPGF